MINGIKHNSIIGKNICFLLCIFLMLSMLTACQTPTSGPSSKAVDKISVTDFVMDTVLNISLYTAADGEQKAKEIKENLEQLEKEELSWRIPDSMAARINRECANGQSTQMDDSFSGWTRICLDLARKSGGSFDPTIGNLTRLWNIEGDNPHVPAREDIDACLSRIGYQYINIEGNLISMADGVSLDLGAVGKGIGCDIVEDYLKDNPDISAAIVAIGGSVIVYGEKPDGSDWNVAIQDPAAKDGNPMGVLSLQGTQYISTSGDYEKYFIENGKKYHHILDPASGYPSESGLHSVTIVCDNGLLSDGLSTACFILGEEAGMKLVEEYGAEAVFINDKDEVIVSNGLKDHFTIMERTYQMK